MKTIELDRTQLDWAVAQALRLDTVISDGGLVFVGGEVFMPHAYWEQGGPIIEQEQIDLQCFPRKSGGVVWRTFHAEGPTPLIAAMRCFVASRLGDDVTVPDGLV